MKTAEEWVTELSYPYNTSSHLVEAVRRVQADARRATLELAIKTLAEMPTSRGWTAYETLLHGQQAVRALLDDTGAFPCGHVRMVGATRCEACLDDAGRAP